MYKGKKIFAIIPARLGSKRLKRKNIRLVNGKPMMSYAIDACKKVKEIEDVYVSTESYVIADIAKKNGAKVVIRPKHLAEDNVPTQDILKHFAQKINFDIVVLVQANSPQVYYKNIKKAIDILMGDETITEVRSINKDLKDNGAIWTLRRETIFWDGLSHHQAFVIDNAIDVHSKEDLEKVCRLIKNGS